MVASQSGQSGQSVRRSDAILSSPLRRGVEECNIHKRSELQEIQEIKLND